MNDFIKNNLKIIIAIIITFIVTLSMGVYATIKLQANEIEYNNTTLDEVLDDLYSKTNSNGNIKLFNFSNQYMNTGYCVQPSDFVAVENDVWLHSVSTFDYTFESNDNYEFSFDVFYGDTSVELMGGLYFILSYEENEVARFSLNDGWLGILKTAVYVTLKNNVLYNDTTESPNCSGKYSIVKSNNNLYFYKNNSLLATVSSNDSIKIDKIKLGFQKYPGYNIPNMCVKNIYIGSVTN